MTTPPDNPYGAPDGAAPPPAQPSLQAYVHGAPAVPSQYGPAAPVAPSPQPPAVPAPYAGYQEPGYQSGYAQPGYAQPAYAQPGAAQPGYAQPGYAPAGYPGYQQPVAATSSLYNAAVIVNWVMLGITVVGTFGIGIIAAAWMIPMTLQPQSTARRPAGWVWLVPERHERGR